jgi:hypothetical protein
MVDVAADDRITILFDAMWEFVYGPSRQAAFFGPTVANGA